MTVSDYTLEVFLWFDEIGASLDLFAAEELHFLLDVLQHFILILLLFYDLSHQDLVDKFSSPKNQK
jgi:hypothetical protein